MMPATLKTTMRGPPASSASRKLPGPLSLRFVTTNTFPPRPPKLYMPPPCAPGNAGIGACGRSPGFAAHGMYGLPLASHSLMTGSAFCQASSEWRSESVFFCAASRRTSSGTRGILGACVRSATSTLITSTTQIIALDLKAIADSVELRFDRCCSFNRACYRLCDAAFCFSAKFFSACFMS